MPVMDERIVGLAAAIAAGLLVGLERGWAQRKYGAGHRVAGFRTFGLIGFAGGAAGLLPDIIAAVLLLGVTLTLVFGYARKATEDRLSATTTIAGVLTLGIGLAAVRLSPSIALAAAAAAFMLLAARHSMHGLLRGMSEKEIDAVARFALVALVILPLLPDAEYGPYGAWNPRRIWMVVVLVAAISFAGYVVVKSFGSNRGILVAAMAGAIVSSTAVTADYARRMRTQPEARGALIAGIVLASIISYLRVQLVALVLAPRALPSLALAMVPAMVVAGVLALLAWQRQSDGSAPPIKLGNPFDFGPALLLAGLVAIFSVAARWALANFGGHGTALVIALTGMMDVDAAVLTLSGMPVRAIDSGLAGLALAVAVLFNTAVKAVLAMIIAPGRMGVAAALPLLTALAASIAGIVLYLTL